RIDPDSRRGQGGPVVVMLITGAPPWGKSGAGGPRARDPAEQCRAWRDRGGRRPCRRLGLRHSGTGLPPSDAVNDAPNRLVRVAKSVRLPSRSTGRRPRYAAGPNAHRLRGAAERVQTELTGSPLHEVRYRVSLAVQPEVRLLLPIQ